MAERKPRGEIAELSLALQNLCTIGKRSDKELRLSKKEVFKKVINYMTLGMDMSSLFPMMTSCANLSSDDVVLKKMLYLYITHYSSQTPDLALLTINQLRDKDCRDQDPTVRGLALRSLCSLRVSNFLEYVLDPVMKGLEDKHPYVRRTAVMGVLKIHHINSDVVEHNGMLDAVKTMLYQDPDVQVVANCLAVLMKVDEVSQLAKDKALVYNLINRIKEFSDWSQCQVLELASHYRPSSESEIFDILNALEDRLSHVNSAVVMATIKVFLHQTLNMTATHQQVLERVKEPLKSLISREEPATAYAVLCHVLLLAQRAAMIFENDYVSFYCRTHEPWYIKKVKMEILTAIASSTNVYEIVGELTEYARDISPIMAREAVKAVGRIALNVSDVHGLVERLLIFLESGSEHIIGETLIQMKDLLRKYPDLGSVSIFTIGDMRLSSIAEPEAKASLVWILGQFGDALQSAPYTLEAVAETFASEDVGVRLALLTAAARLFFKRPPEAQRLLGSVLAAGLNDNNQDVHDRALLYYRLLRYDVQSAAGIINCPLPVAHFFADEMSSDQREKVFAQFNSLSVIYSAPEATFVEQVNYHADEEGAQEENHRTLGDVATANGDIDGPVDTGTTLLASAAEEDLLGLDAFPVATTSAPAQPPPSTMFNPPGPAPAPVTTSLLDLDLGLGLGGEGYNPGPAPPPPPEPELMLNAQAKVGPSAFQERWKALQAAHSYSVGLSGATVDAMGANGHRDFTQHMAQAYIMTIASGGQPPMYRYYFYAQTTHGSLLFLVEMVVQTATRQANVTIKADDEGLLPQFVDLWSNCLAGFYR